MFLSLNILSGDSKGAYFKGIEISMVFFVFAGAWIFLWSSETLCIDMY
jgi:hypothetical protein